MINQKSNQDLLVNESLYFTGNGYIGVRGNFEEGYPKDVPTIRGSYLNGFYETVDLEYGESAHGFPTEAQKLVNVFDAQTVELEFDGDRFSLFLGELTHLSRRLDIERGVAIREMDWISPKGHHLVLSIKRMASFACPELFMIHYELTSVNYTGQVSIRSKIEGNVSNYTNPKDPRVGAKHAKLLHVKDRKIEAEMAQVVGKTLRSELSMATSIAHDLPMDYRLTESGIEGVGSLSFTEGTTVLFTKFVVYTDSRKHENVEDQGRHLLQEARQKGWDHWARAQKTYLDSFWSLAKISIEGDSDASEAINYHLYQLLASTGQDGKTNISAKGLSGEGYEGHYFWDTEIYMIPFFTLTKPEIAKKLLRFRHETLPGAKQEAQKLGHSKGAKIPWRTIAGSECSAYFPGGSAQYHINADVAYANIQYFLATLDIDYLYEYGYEVLLETARLWLDVGHFDNQGRFLIDGVTGPDEYTAMVNNNYYTNSMAGYHFRWVVKFANLLQEKDAKRWQKLVWKLDLSKTELEQMGQAANDMYLPYSEQLGIHLQDDHFLGRKEWDFEHIPKDKYPLVLHYHPLTIYRHKVLKQADTVLAHFLLDEADEEIIKRSFHYYEPLTTHDSSLSPCVHSMMAARIKESTKAYDYFLETMKLDLENRHKNTKDGLHIANAGGVYMAIVYGFGGLRIKENGLHVRPRKPKQWNKLVFRIRYREATLTITLGERFQVESDRPIDLWIEDSIYHVSNEVEVPYLV